MLNFGSLHLRQTVQFQLGFIQINCVTVRVWKFLLPRSVVYGPVVMLGVGMHLQHSYGKCQTHCTRQLQVDLLIVPANCLGADVCCVMYWCLLWCIGVLVSAFRLQFLSAFGGNRVFLTSAVDNSPLTASNCASCHSGHTITALDAVAARVERSGSDDTSWGQGLSGTVVG